MLVAGRLHRRRSLMQQLQALAVSALLAVAVLPCFLKGGVSNAQSTWLRSGITSNVSLMLGLNEAMVTTSTGVLQNVSSLLTTAIQCSGRLCVDLNDFKQTISGLADINAKVLLWSPKVANTPAGDFYDPYGKDWASVIATCRAVFSHEKRLASFFVRASFHDAMAVDVSMCPGPDCGGADSSLLLTIDELTRPENMVDSFAAMTERVTKKIASFFDISAADALAVCAAVAPEVLSGGRVKILPADGTKVLRVGRLDSITPAPPGQLPSAGATIPQFASFWSIRGFSMSEAVALMGSHSLFDTQGCFQGPSPSSFCDPAIQDCSNVRMHRWENHYYRDICSPTLTVTPLNPGDPPEFAETPIFGMTRTEFDALARDETCKWTSNEGRAMALNKLRLMHAGVLPEFRPPLEPFNILWSNFNCTAGKAFGVTPSNCPHPSTWFYTPNDAMLGQACQGAGTTSVDADIRSAARSFLNQSNWDTLYRSAYIKMVTVFASFSPVAETLPMSISGNECVSSGSVQLQQSVLAPCPTTVLQFRDASNGQQVASVVARFPAVLTAATLRPPSPLPAVNITDVPVRTYDRDLSFEHGLRQAPTITVNGVFSDPPVSLYADPALVCPATDGVSVRVNGYLSSPFRWSPFSSPFKRPPSAQVASTFCKDGTNFCTDAYEIDVFPVSVNIGCPAGPTWLLSYNGSVPGPTFRAIKGRQTLVRYNNQMTVANLSGSPFAAFHPCDTDPRRQGRPISVHFHGEASLAPYDGWAEDSTCGGESKDYYYPNRRPGFLWYHDHQLEITSDNAYFGLAGMYITHDKAPEGGCGEPWNLDNVEDTEMVFKDVVFDSTCQLHYDRAGIHRNNLYGDVNTVNGVPWPVFNVQPRWHRFRWLNAAVTRPWKPRIVDSSGNDVSGSVCQVIAGDGGFRRTPSPFPPEGIFMGVAERYEVVCDFTNYGGQTLYLWNSRDVVRMKDVPFFCHSHLMMKIKVARCDPGAVCAPTGSEFVGLGAARPALDAVLSSETDIPAALAMVRNRQCHRTFRFGRRRGQWVINGETWHSARVAAGDIGQNTWELWCLETGGGWFHPLHIHLVDFYVLARNHDEAQVHEYERFTPKDVVQLDPGAHVSILVRFGPHRGEYMFHCHNLVHEDTEMLRSYRVMSTATGLTRDTALAMQSQPALVQSLDVIYDLYDDPVYPPAGPRLTASLSPLLLSSSPSNQAALAFAIDNGLYRIFYPGGTPNESPLLQDPSVNPWLVFRATGNRCPPLR